MVILLYNFMTRLATWRILNTTLARAALTSPAFGVRVLQFQLCQVEPSLLPFARRLWYALEVEKAWHSLEAEPAWSPAMAAFRHSLGSLESR